MYAEGSDDDVDVGIASGHQHDRQFGVLRAQQSTQREAVDVSQTCIEQHEIGAELRSESHRVGAMAVQCHAEPVCLEGVVHRSADCSIVLDEQDVSLTHDRQRTKDCCR